MNGQSGLLQETEDVPKINLVVLRIVQSVLNLLLDLVELLLVGMHLSSLNLILHLVFLPVKETLQVPEGVVGDTLVELSLDFALASAIDALVVDHQLSGLGVTRRFHADQVAFVIDFEEVAEEQEDSVFDVLVRDLLLAFFTVHARDLRLIAGLVDTRELHVLLARGVGTLKGKAGNRPVLEVVLGLRL